MEDRKSWIKDDIFTSATESKTLAAWKPFNLCVALLFEFQNSEVEPRWGHWQIQWIAGLTLLRTIGHVLDKVDSLSSDTHKSVVLEKWREWKDAPEENWVFWEFIQQERNSILKEFKLGFVDGPYLEPDEYEIEPIVLQKLTSFREAVYWWRKQLREIETKTAEGS